VSKKAIPLQVNAPETAVVLDVAAMCSTPPKPSKSPIDQFYEHVGSLVTRTADSKIANDATLMRLLLIETVSAAEFYFRTILSSVLRVCPLARTTAAKQLVSIHAVGFYDRASLGFGIYEGRSLSDEAGVKKFTGSVLGIQIPPNSSVDVALAAFECICQIRHGAVHAQGHLWSNNVLDIGLDVEHPAVVVITPDAFQTAAAITTNAIRAYNRFVCEAIVDRWIIKKHLTGNWSDDRDDFSALYSVFYSAKDAVLPASAYKTYLRIRSDVRSRLSYI
jgi:hypothetical protein